MQYMALIYSAEGASDVDEQTLMAQYGTFTQDAVAAGVFKAGDALQPIATASSVRVKAGKPVVTDGPFAETKEVLGGYYLLDCANLDEALAWAARIPTARYGTIEVRPIIVWEE